MSTISIDVKQPQLVRDVVVHYSEFMDAVYYDYPDFIPQELKTTRFARNNAIFELLLMKINDTIKNNKTKIELLPEDIRCLTFATAFYLKGSNSFIIGLMGMMPPSDELLDDHNLMNAALNILYKELKNKELSEDRAYVFDLMVTLWSLI